jgi:hypothetical protein
MERIQCQLTASTLNAVLSFINPVNTPKIAFDNDDYAMPLVAKLKEAVGDKDGSQKVSLSFNNGEEELLRQFKGVCKNIECIFADVHYTFDVLSR